MTNCVHFVHCVLCRCIVRCNDYESLHAGIVYLSLKTTVDDINGQLVGGLTIITLYHTAGW